MSRKSVFPHDRHRFIRREVVLVVLQNCQIARGEQSVGRVSGDQIHLLIEQRAIKQAQIQDSRLGGELQTVNAREAGISVRALHELVAKAGAPVVRVRAASVRVRQMQSARVFAAHHDRESVVESERGQHCEVKSLARTRACTFPKTAVGSLSIGSCRIAVSAVPVYST